MHLFYFKTGEQGEDRGIRDVIRMRGERITREMRKGEGVKRGKRGQGLAGLEKCGG